MVTHTAGPWHIDEDTRDGMEWNRHIYAGADNRVCFMSNDEGLGHGLANARLIAAAPDLLALAHQYRADLRHPPSADSITRRLAAIDAVLAKATGDA